MKCAMKNLSLIQNQFDFVLFLGTADGEGAVDGGGERLV